MKVSIITINLNDKEGLTDSIKSVINQDFKDFEFIVIDGDSNDGSVDVVRQYADKINYWVCEPDKGIYDAMNKAIKVAKGDYCFFLNSGDILTSDSVLSEIFQDNPQASFISLDFSVVKDGELKLIKLYDKRSWDLALYDIYAGFLCHQAFLIRKDNFDKYGLYDDSLKIISDWKHFLNAIGVHHEKVVYKDICICTVKPNGVSQNASHYQVLGEKMKVMDELVSPQTLKRLNELYYYESNGYIIDIILSRKWIHRGFRLFCKIGRTLGFVNKEKSEN